MNLSGLRESNYYEFEYYVPHFHAALEEYSKLKEARVDQKKFIVDRISQVKKIQEVRTNYPNLNYQLRINLCCTTGSTCIDSVDRKEEWSQI